MSISWNECLKDALVQQYGAEKGALLYQKYDSTFPLSYLNDYSHEMAASDIGYLEKISVENPLGIHLYHLPEDNEKTFHLRLLTFQKTTSLSEILPILHNFNLRTDSENQHKVTIENGKIVWISDFVVVYIPGNLDLISMNILFKKSFTSVYFGKYTNDGFNKLVLAAALTCQEIRIFRTYAKYLQQAGFRFRQSYIEHTLVQHIAITKDLLNLFYVMHDPRKITDSKESAPQLEQRILQALETIPSLDQDKIINLMFNLIKATMRTNYFQVQENNEPYDYLSFKFSSNLIPDLPLPVPLYEIFIYSRRFEAIHLRNTKVARGGIRWSDRHEDFRTEILGLMKTQVVKNSVIVPSGAKGGFVLKGLPTNATREMIQEEVISCYKEFIRSLLQLTDNIVNDKTIRPTNVVCYDDVDPYLVVAADKGTASFSNIANSISKEYNFWLGDAFASGGSAGYDHKKLGITARGAWESIKRHFCALNINVETTNFTAVGIGDMSGDVFGNGMIYSSHIQLLAAFDHRDIFIDPTPDPETSYQERVRLFNLPQSSWKDYNANYISRGGGVFSRGLKSIPITHEMQDALGITEDALAPNELIRAILKAPVDLLYNGGVGTYVKASVESQVDAGDRTNDYCRVNGDELRCKVVGEGGNLGFTQRGRIEYALNGGRLNTDFIDNSAGVDCSDHEVNLKILLNAELQKKLLTMEERDALLVSLTQEVAKLVLLDNFSQALVLGFSAVSAKKNMNLYANYLRELENLHILNRSVEFLPTEKELGERTTSGEGLTAPELAVLLAYTKIHLKHEILDSNLPEDPYLSKIIDTAFPPSIKDKYQSAMCNHRLRRDIIATQLSNKIINEMGITFVYRLEIETGATVENMVRAYSVASQIYGTKDLQKSIQTMDFKISLHDQYEMLFNIRQLINLSTRWFLRSDTLLNQDLQSIIDHYSSKIKTLKELVPELMGGISKDYLDKLTEKFLEAELPPDLARKIALFRAIYTTLNIIEVASSNHFDLEQTAKVYFAGGERINLVWFRDQIGNDSREGHWNALARLTLRDELDIAQRALTIVIMKHDTQEKDANKLIEKWALKNKHALTRWEKLLEMLHNSNQIDYSMFFIAIRELLTLIKNSKS